MNNGLFICRVCGGNYCKESKPIHKILNNNGSEIHKSKIEYYCDNCGTIFNDIDKFSLKPVEVRILDDDFDIPVKVYPTDSGYDLQSTVDIILKPFEVKLIKSGISIKLPPGFEIQVRPRSSMGKKGILVTNSPGTIDEKYRNDIGILLCNITNTDIEIKRKDKIAQIVFGKVYNFPLIKYNGSNEEFESTDRGMQGFGHSGR